MSDAVSNAIAAPVLVVIAGRECKLSYSMHAVLVYRAETARIERSRPQLEEPDPKCICGGRRSEHVGPNLIRLSDSTTAPEILCLRFRKEDRTSGDSLYDWRAWLEIDLNIDPERWLACLWAGLHERQADGKTWKAPFTFDELQETIGLSPEVRAVIDAKMREAMTAWFPKAKPKDASPNGQAAPDAGPAPSTTVSQTNAGSTPEHAVASDSIVTSS